MNTEAAKKQLETLKAEIEKQSRVDAATRNPVELDQQAVGRLSRMDALQVQAMAQARERTRKADLIRIDLALRRIEDDEYGYCIECGDEIAPRRLEIDPMAERCIKCA